MDGQKSDFSKEISMTVRDVDDLKKNMVDRCSLKEMLALKQQLVSQIQSKVDLKEVQNVLNDCQNDIGNQLGQFKQKIQEKMSQQEVSMTRLIERKADHNDFKAVVDEQLSKSEAFQQFVSKPEFDEVRMKYETIMKIQQDTMTKPRK